MKVEDNGSTEHRSSEEDAAAIGRMSVYECRTVDAARMSDGAMRSMVAARECRGLLIIIELAFRQLCVCRLRSDLTASVRLRADVANDRHCYVSLTRTACIIASWSVSCQSRRMHIAVPSPSSQISLTVSRSTGMPVAAIAS